MKNPWPGLASYTEESEYQFNGRSAASATLSALIQRNLFVTLYGRSGIGKTSLLQAGVYPLLRGEGLSPVTIRLNDVQDEKKEEKNQETKDNPKEKEQAEAAPAAQILWEKLLAELSKSGVQYLPCDGKDTYSPVFTDVMVLRSLFSAGRFLKKVDKEDKKEDEGVTPVIVLDQFEELFYQDPAAARLLVSQLYALIDDNYNLTIPHPTWHEDTIFRIVVSIREDDLFLFEDCIDSLNCVDFKSNRYRLMPLSEEEAKEVILTPKSGMFDADEEREIVDKIISISRNKGDSINTLMLSLLCHVLYDKYSAKREPVKIASLSDYDDIIKIYYQSILKKKKLLKANGKPLKDIEWLEDNLIDEQGRRKSVYLSDFEKYAPKAKELADNSNNRLLNKSQGRVEYIHDQLAASVFKIRSSRKANRYRITGIIIMSIILAFVFVYAFTTIPEKRRLKESESSKELVSLHNNTKVIEYTIEDTVTKYDYTYEISDCPNLKTINIKKPRASLKIYHCPSLVTINTPEKYKGSVTAYNCPNLKKYDFCEIDTSYNNESESGSFGYYDCVSYSSKYETFNFFDSYTGEVDVYAKKLEADVYQIRILPYYIKPRKDQKRPENAYNQVKITTWSDEIKSMIDCYVPWGYMDRFQHLRAFQPFRSVKELDLFSTIRIGLSEAYGIYKSYGFWFNVFNTIIFLIGLWLFFHYKKQLSRYNENIVIRVAKSILYSILTLSVCLLAWLSFYWFFFRIVHCNSNTIVSASIAVIPALICLGIILKPNFWMWLKNTICSGLRNLRYFSLKEFVKSLMHRIISLYCFMCSFLKRHIKRILLSLFVFIIGVSIFYLYQDGKTKRERYLYALSNLDYAKVPLLIDALEKQHGSFLYPFFTDSLNNLKRQINEKITSSTFQIRPNDLNYIAFSNNGIDLSATEIYLEAISNDGNGLCIKVRNDRSGNEQMVYYDFLSEKLDTITPKNNLGISYISVFSPSGKTLVCYDEADNHEHGSIYNVETRKPKGTPEKFPYNQGIIMANDNEYYYLSYDTLHKGRLNSKTEPAKVRDLEPLSFDYIHLIDSENIVAWENCSDYFIIYNLKQDSIIYRTKEHESLIIGFGDDSFRGINSEYVVSNEGVFDLKQDSLIIDSYDDMYMWNSLPVKIREEDNQFVLYDIKGKHIKTVLKANDDKSYRISFLGNNYLYTNDGSSIFIYNLGTKLNRNVKITDYDKKVFDLE